MLTGLQYREPGAARLSRDPANRHRRCPTARQNGDWDCLDRETWRL